MVCGFIDLHQAHVFASSDRDDHPLRTLHRHAVEERVGNRAFGGLKCTAVAFGFAGTHHRLAHFVHHRTHVGKVEVDEARHDHQVGDAPYALLQHFIGKQKCFLESRIRVGDQEEVLVRNDDQRVNMLLEFGNPRVCRAHSPRTFEQEGLGDDPYRQNVHFTGRAGDNRGSACSGAAAHAGCDEAHMRTLQCAFDLLDRFFGGCTSDFGARTCTQTLCDIWTKLYPIFGGRGVERLSIGVCDYKVDAFNARANHVGDRIAPCATDTDDCNFRLQFIDDWRTDVDAHSCSLPWPVWRNHISKRPRNLRLVAQNYGQNT